jgi:hypothetical protein
MAHLHTDMELLYLHVALEVCEIVIESATTLAILEFRCQMFKRDPTSRHDLIDKPARAVELPQ